MASRMTLGINSPRKGFDAQLIIKAAVDIAGLRRKGHRGLAGRQGRDARQHQAQGQKGDEKFLHGMHSSRVLITHRLYHKNCLSRNRPVGNLQLPGANDCIHAASVL